MNRLNLVQTGSRIELPASISSPEDFDKPARLRRFAPITLFYIGIAGFMSCGVAVIVTASMIALSIQ